MGRSEKIWSATWSEKGHSWPLRGARTHWNWGKNSMTRPNLENRAWRKWRDWWGKFQRATRNLWMMQKKCVRHTSETDTLYDFVAMNRHSSRQRHTIELSKLHGKMPNATEWMNLMKLHATFCANSRLQDSSQGTSPGKKTSQKTNVQYMLEGKVFHLKSTQTLMCAELSRIKTP